MESFWGQYMFDGGKGLGGLTRATLSERIGKSCEAMRAGLRELSHPHASAYDRACSPELQHQMLQAAKIWVLTHPDGITPNLLDVVAMGVLRSGIDAGLRHRLFGGVSLESELTAPVAKRLRREGLRVETEVPVLGSRADVLGYKDGAFSRRIVIEELKNAVSEVDRLAGQIADYRRACDALRVVMTPECLAEIAIARGELTRPLAFADFVREQGAELWTYDAQTEEFVQHSDGSHSYEMAVFDEVWASVTATAEAA